MPLFLLYLSNIGDILATSFKWTYSRLCKCQRGRGKGIFGRSAAPQAGILKHPESYRIKYLPGQIHSGLFGAPLSEESNSSNISASGKVSANPVAVGVAPEPEVAASEYSIGADDILEVPFLLPVEF